MSITLALPSEAAVASPRFGLPQRLVLAAGAFAIATSEFLMMGTLPEVADGLGVSVSAAGQLVGAFALGIALGGPMLAGATARFDRRNVLVGAMLAFLLANLLLAALPSYWLALGLRFLGGALGGLFYGVAFASVARMSEPGKEAGAIATVLSGVTLATVFGTPLGAWAGQIWGWRLPYAAIAAAAVLIALAAWRLLPAMAGDAAIATGLRGAGAGIVKMLGVFRLRALALIFLAIALVNTGWFTVYTYIAPFWTGIGDVAAGWVPGALLAYGVFSAIGGAWGGALANGGARRIVALAIFAQGLVFIAIALAAGAPIAMLALSMAWGLSAWVFVSAAQARVVELAGDKADLASSVAVSAFNVGNAAGALLGGLAVGLIGLASLPFVGLGLLVAGLIAALRAR
jgi:DHA1 family inner membrane transport protein